MTCSSWVALYDMAHSFIELDKAVVHVVSLVSFLNVEFLNDELNTALPFNRKLD